MLGDPGTTAGGRLLVTFLTDWGLAWGPVGTCHAVMRSITPGLEIVDLSHAIPPFDVRAGAWVLASALPYAPQGVHVAVVDPGVGTARLPLALRCVRGDVRGGPVNGLLLPAAARLGGVREAREIAHRALMLHPVSATFHGRDIFAPAAAHLASGVPYGEVGPPVGVERLVPAPWAEPEYGEGSARGEVALLDHFGNVRTTIRADRFPLEPGGRVRVAAGAGEARELPVARTFGEVTPGELFAFDDSSGYVCLARNRGSAGEALDASTGDSIALEIAG